jgi:hypothetical protein
MSNGIRSSIDIRANLSVPIFLDLETRQIPIISSWLSMQDLGLLDMAVSSHSARRHWLIILKFMNCQAIDRWRQSHSSLMWAMKRCLNVTHILVNIDYSDKVSDLTLEAVGINGNLTFGIEEVRDDCILSTRVKRKYLLSIDLSCTEGITDRGRHISTSSWMW